MSKFKFLQIIILWQLVFAAGVSAQEFSLSAEEFYSYGLALFKEQRYDEAAQELEKCLILNPQHSQAKQLLNLCKEETEGDREEAMLSALNEAKAKIELKPEFPEEPPQEEEPLAPPIQRGAWVLKKGQMYAEIYTKYFWHNHSFNSKGKKERWAFDGKGNEIRTELKLEYGFSDELTLLFSIVAKEAHWKDIFRSSTKRGFTEASPGIKYLLFQEPFICALQTRAKFPFDYSEEAIPALGRHQIDGELKLLTAQPWPRLSSYTKCEFGFRVRNEEPTNEFPYFFEFGYNLLPQIIIKTTLDGVEGLAQTGGIDEDWLKYTVGPILKIKDSLAIEIGFGHTFYGKNTSAAKEVIVSFSSLW